MLIDALASGHRFQFIRIQFPQRSFHLFKIGESHFEPQRLRSLYECLSIVCRGLFRGDTPNFSLEFLRQRLVSFQSLFELLQVIRHVCFPPCHPSAAPSHRVSMN